MGLESEITSLVNRLNKYRESYYNEGKSLISDEQFDFEEQRLKELDPNNDYFRQVGRSVNTRDIKIEHEIPMLSMQKVQTAEDAVKWFYEISKVPGLYFNDKMGLSLWVDPKLDGVSGKIVFDSHGNYLYASTRGDGKIGAKLPHAHMIDGVPKKFLPDCELRGEFIINKKYAKNFSGPLRNTCSGILKRIDWTEDMNFVSFVIYDFHSYNPKYNINFVDRGDKIKQISKILTDMEQKFNIIPVEKISNIPELYNRYVNKLRKEWPYETDGVIFTIDGGQDNYDLINSKYIINTFNRYNMALKPPAEYTSSVVTDIVTEVNRQKLSFIALIEPVYINGVKVGRATLDNYQRMRKNRIGIGSMVLVKRTNDVIPKIVESYNETGKEIKYINPTKCPACGTKLVTYYQDIACPNEYGCVGIFQSKLEQMFNSLEVKNIGPAALNGLANYMKNNDIPMTFSSLFSGLLNIDGNFIGQFLNEFYGTEKRIAIFKEAIRYMFDNLYEINLLDGFNIPTIRKGELIKHNIRCVKDLFDYIAYLNKRNYFSSVFDSVLFTWSQDPVHMKDLKDCYNILNKYFKKEAGIKEGSITYCISGPINGMSRTEVIKYLKSVNPDLVFVKDVITNLNFLISYEKGTTKVLKAKKYNIPVVTLEEVIEKYKN